MKRLLLAAMLLCLLTGNAFANFITYDAKADFNGSVNGAGGNWRYGWSDNETSALNDYTNANSFNDTVNKLQGFRNYSGGGADTLTPGVFKAYGSSTLHGYQNGDLIVHPGRIPTNSPNAADEKFSVVRFVAPTAGIYNLASNWIRKGTSSNAVGTPDIRVYISRSSSPTSLFSGNFDFNQLGTFSVNGLSLTAGETIDFRVGGLGERNGDVTISNVTITAVPEPGSLACVSGLVAGLSVLSRRRRQA
ncbi:MAG: hypothetical protein ACK5D7_03180 [Planctomycetota bacterium]